MSEHEMEKEMPAVRGVGEEVLGTLASLNKKAKEIQKSSVRIQERKEREQREFIEEIDLSSSSSLEVEEFVPPTLSKFDINLDRLYIDIECRCRLKSFGEFTIIDLVFLLEKQVEKSQGGKGQDVMKLKRQHIQYTLIKIDLNKVTVYNFTEIAGKKPRTFYGKSKISRENKTAMEALKRTKALETVNKLKIGKYVVDISILLVCSNFVSVTFRLTIDK